MKRLDFTLCFIKRGDEILLINRDKSPWFGRWNGVGGKIEDGEDPKDAIHREVYEETLIKLTDVKDCGIVTWNVDGEDRGGMHIYLAEVSEDFSYDTPRKMPEGILDWKSVDWILDDSNTGIVENIQKFLPYMLYENARYHHHCVFENNVMEDFTTDKAE